MNSLICVCNSLRCTMSSLGRSPAPSSASVLSTNTPIRRAKASFAAPRICSGLIPSGSTPNSRNCARTESGTSAPPTFSVPDEPCPTSELAPCPAPTSPPSLIALFGVWPRSGVCSPGTACAPRESVGSPDWADLGSPARFTSDAPRCSPADCACSSRAVRISGAPDCDSAPFLGPATMFCPASDWAGWAPERESDWLAAVSGAPARGEPGSGADAAIDRERASSLGNDRGESL